MPAELEASGALATVVSITALAGSDAACAVLEAGFGYAGAATSTFAAGLAAAVSFFAAAGFSAGAAAAFEAATGADF